MTWVDWNHLLGRGSHHSSLEIKSEITNLSVCLSIVGSEAGEGLRSSLAELVIDSSLMALEQCDTLVHAADWCLRVVHLHWLTHLRTML